MVTPGGRAPGGIQTVGSGTKLNIIVYGYPGSGKTRLIGTCPNPEKTLIIRPPTDHTDSIRGTGIKEVEIRTWDAMDEYLAYLRNTNGDGWEWVWLDSISLFQDTGLDDVWADTIARNPRRAQYGLDKPEYGINMFRLKRWVRHTVGTENRSFHLGITAHPAELMNQMANDEDEETNTVFMPWIQGKNMATGICGYMNIVASLRWIKKKDGRKVRVLIAEGDSRWYGKDQYLALGQRGRMEDPTIPKIMSGVTLKQPTRAQRRRVRVRRG